MRRGVKSGIIGTVFAGMLGVAGFGAYNIYDDLDGGGGGGGAGTHTAATAAATKAPLSAKDIADTAADFLSAWASGDITQAASLTDSVRTSTAALDAYKAEAHATVEKIVPGAAAAEQVPFTVTSNVAYQGAGSTWSYGSSLSVVRGATGKPVVQWKPSVLHPDLADGDTLVTGQAKAPDVDIVDRRGRVMNAADYPSLTQIFLQLKTRYADRLGAGTPGIETYVQGADGTQKRTLNVLKKGVDAKLRTTLDSSIQAAAEKAVKAKSETSGVTALDTRTGGILAVAFSPVGGTDHALMDQRAPGSTFKIVTATALLNAGLTPNTPSPCRSGDNYKYGKAYRNVSPDNPSATLRWDFEQSCNTGIIKLAGKGNVTSSTLPDTGSRYYGFGSNWSIGTSTLDAKIPGGTDDEMTSEMIGQGNLLLSPLNMASVSATVREGRFHQPTILQDTGLITDRTSISTSPLPSGVRRSLQSMMSGTVTYGTAHRAMSGIPGVTGAKTGSAEAGTVQPNGWFTAYRDHVAAAALVVQGGHGGDSAGPLVAAVLRAS